MLVVVLPVIVGDRICRIVSPVAALLEVEEWAGAWWEPSSVTLSEVSAAQAATGDQLRARGVPEADWVAPEVRPPTSDIEAQLITNDPARSAVMRFDEEAVRVGGRRKKYPGNARFNRDPYDRGQPGRGDERRKDDKGEWKGPWRRKTDVPPDTPP